MKKSILIGFGTVALVLGGTASVCTIGSSVKALPTETLAKADSTLLETIRVDVTVPDWGGISDVQIKDGTVTHLSGRTYRAEINTTYRYNEIQVTFAQDSATFYPNDGNKYMGIGSSGWLPGWSYTLNITGYSGQDSSTVKYYSHDAPARVSPLTSTRFYFEKYNDWQDASIYGFQKINKIGASGQDTIVFTKGWGSGDSLPEIEGVVLDGHSVYVADVPYLAEVTDVAKTYYIYYDNNHGHQSADSELTEGAYYSFGDKGAMIANADKGKALDLIMKIKGAMGTASTIYGSRENSICKILDDPAEILSDYSKLGSAKTVFDNATINTYIEGVNKDYSTKGAVKFGDIIEFITEKTSAAGLVSIVGHGTNSTLMIATITAVGVAAAGTMIFFARKRKEI